MTVEENLELGAFAPRARARRTARLEHVYTIFPVLRERRRQLARALSGGQQQMVAIGRALMAGPTPLILPAPSLRPPPRPLGALFYVPRAIKPRGACVPPPGGKKHPA